MKKILAAASIIALGLGALAYAQGTTATPVALVVTTCGASTIYLAGRPAPLTVDPTGVAC